MKHHPGEFVETVPGILQVRKSAMHDLELTKVTRPWGPYLALNRMVDLDWGTHRFSLFLGHTSFATSPILTRSSEIRSSNAHERSPASECEASWSI